MTLKSRILRILLVALVVLGFGGYFAFSTFLFSPLEGAYESNVATLVPRNVDFFVAKARLSEDFAPFPRLAFEEELVATAAWHNFVNSDDFAELDRAWGLERLRAELDALPGQLRGIDPLKVFGGKHVAVAGWFRGPDLAQADWAVYGRANWLGKLGVSLLSFPGLLRLEAQGLSAAVESDHVALSGGRLARELFVTRVRDVVVLGTSLELVEAARELEARAGQDSFGQSAQYFDHVENAHRGPRRDEVEAYVDWRAWSEKARLSGRWPALDSQDFATAFAARLFQLGSLRALSGVVGIDRGVRAHLHADLSSELISPAQSRIYRQRGADRRAVLTEAASLAPSATGAFLYMNVPVGDLLTMMLDAAEPDLRTNLDSVLRSTGKFTGSEQLIAELDSLFKNRVALVVRTNDYPVNVADDPPSDGQPVYAVALVLWTDGGEKVRARIDELHRMAVTHQQSLGLQGPEANKAVFKNVVASGHEIWEFWSPLIAGTGHLATAIDGERYILSNSFRMVGDLIRTFYGQAGPQLAERTEFKGLVNEGLPQCNLLLWLDPRELGRTARERAERSARDSVLGSIDMARERLREEAQVLRQEFGGRRPADLAPPERARLDELVDARMDELRDRVLREQVPTVAGRILRRLQYVELCTAALVMVALDPKQVELSLGALVPLEQP